MRIPTAVAQEFKNFHDLNNLTDLKLQAEKGNKQLKDK